VGEHSWLKKKKKIKKSYKIKVPFNSGREDKDERTETMPVNDVNKSTMRSARSES